MNKVRPRFVVDASVGIKLFVDEPLSEQAHALFAKLSEDPPAELYVPDLFFIECTNVLLKYMRRFGRSLEDSQADTVDLNKLALKPVSTADLMTDALLLASQMNLTAYDACYAVLAHKLNIPLITADEPTAQAAGWATGSSILHAREPKRGTRTPKVLPRRAVDHGNMQTQSGETRSAEWLGGTELHPLRKPAAPSGQHSAVNAGALIIVF